MSALLQFEDFAAPRQSATPSFTSEAIAQEYDRGFAAGEAAGRDASMTQLTETLAAALNAAEDEARIRRHAVSDTLNAIAPILDAVAMQLAALPGDRLADHLLAELTRLCQAGIAPTCRLSGGVELIERLGNRIEELGLRGVTLLPGPRTEITFDGGRITVEPDAILARIRAILAEIQPGTED